MEKNLAKKLFIYLSLLFLIPLFDGLYIYYFFKNSTQSTIKNLDIHFSSSLLSKRLRGLNDIKDSNWKSYLLTGAPDNYQEFLESNKLFSETLEKLKVSPLYENKLKILNEIDLLSTKKIAMMKEAIKSPPQTKTAFAQLLKYKIRPTNRRLQSIITDLIKAETVRYNVARSEIDSTRHRLLQHILLSTILPLLIGIFILFLVRSLLIQSKKNHETVIKAVKSRDDVLAIVSHDLKNPLSTIMLSIELLKRKMTKENIKDESMLKTISSIDRASQVMDDLILNLLDQSKLEADKLILDLKEEDLSEIIQEVELILTPIAKEKSITIQNKLPPDPLTILCDKKRLMQVFSNLIGNAIKFLDIGDKIEVEAHQEEKNIVISIKDTGPGIAPEALPHLFDRYWQVKETAKMGTGLGLAIVKGFVEAHGGKIWVTSQLNSGSTFTFTLPCIPKDSRPKF